MKPNYSLDDLRYFCMVAQFGSFKQAAQSLSIPLSTLSRRIRQLEENLQLRLLNRDAHRVLLTNSGERYFQRFQAVFEEFDHLAEELYSEKHLPKGKIRISAPISAGEHFLSSIFHDFSLEYPDIQLDLHISNTLIDIESEAIDVAFRVGNVIVENWIARRLKDIQFILCASPDIDVSGVSGPEDLCGKPVVICHPMATWQLVNTHTKQEYDYQPNKGIRMEVNEVQIGMGGVKRGMGIGYVPDYLAFPMIERGELTRVLPEWGSKPRTLFMLYRDRDQLPVKVRLFIEFVMARFR